MTSEVAPAPPSRQSIPRCALYYLEFEQELLSLETEKHLYSCLWIKYWNFKVQVTREIPPDQCFKSISVFYVSSLHVLDTSNALPSHRVASNWFISTTHSGEAIIRQMYFQCNHHVINNIGVSLECQKLIRLKRKGANLFLVRLS